MKGYLNNTTDFIAHNNLGHTNFTTKCYGNRIRNITYMSSTIVLRARKQISRLHIPPNTKAHVHASHLSPYFHGLPTTKDAHHPVREQSPSTPIHSLAPKNQRGKKTSGSLRCPRSYLRFFYNTLFATTIRQQLSLKAVRI